MVKVTFSLEERPLTFAQKEAGKRLFSSLIARAQAEMQSQDENTAIEEKAGWFGAGGSAGAATCFRRWKVIPPH
jgi:hypothetical protein